MAMNVGTASGKGPAPVMNVTPLVDVVLVLLIIFMVMTPLLSKKFWVHTPKQEKQEIERPEPADPQPPLVLRVAPDNAVSVNGAAVTVDELPERLRPLGVHKIHALSAKSGKTIHALTIKADLRAVFFVEGDAVFTVDIGTHAIYRA